MHIKCWVYHVLGMSRQDACGASLIAACVLGMLVYTWVGQTRLWWHRGELSYTVQRQLQEALYRPSTCPQPTPRHSVGKKRRVQHTQ